MKKVMSIAAIALMMAGSTAFACDGCGCKEKKAEKKTECAEKSSCSKDKKACDKDKKACTKDAKKSCCDKKAAK